MFSVFFQSRDMSRCTNEFVVNQEESQSSLQKRLEIAIEREKAHALALSNQVFKIIKLLNYFIEYFGFPSFNKKVKLLTI